MGKGLDLTTGTGRIYISWYHSQVWYITDILGDISYVPHLSGITNTYHMATNFGGKIVWRNAEIMTFGGLLKLWHLAEFTLAVEKVLAIIIFKAKWLIERAENLTGPWASIGQSYHSDAWLAQTGCEASSASGRQWYQCRSLQRPRTRHLDCLPRVEKLTLLQPPVSKTLWRRAELVCSCWWWTPCRQLHWCV